MHKLIDIPKKVLKDLYWNQNKTPSQIAQMYNIKNERTVRKKLEKYGIKRKTVSEALTKKRKLPFTGDFTEKAFLLGLRAGDFHARWMKKSIRVQTSTTHPAQFDLLKRAFEKYGETRKYLYKNSPHGPELFIYADLHPSFDFLLKKPEQIPDWILNDDSLFYSFLAAYSDCEGNWHISKSHECFVRVRFRLRTCDKQILGQIQTRLVQLGLHPILYLDRKGGTKSRTAYAVCTNDYYGLVIGQKFEALHLISHLHPFSKHQEKLDKMQYILNNQGCQYCQFIQGWDFIRNKIKEEKNQINNGARTKVKVPKSLIKTCKLGPAVSFIGSPTVSPVTEA